MSVAETMATPHSHGAGATPSVYSRADRPTSFNINDIPVPQGREEDWRFTPINRIERLFSVDHYREDTTTVTVAGPQDVNYEVVDPSDERLEPILAPGDRTAVVSWNATQQIHLIDIPAHATLDAPVMVSIHSNDDDVHAQRLYVRCGEASEAVVIVNHDGHAALNQTIEVDAADEAKLTFVSIHEWDDTSVHASNHRVRAGENTELRHIVVTLGGDLVRVCTDTEFAAPRGSIEMLGLYFVDAGQHLEHRPYIAHTQPNCYSRVTYKGALQGEGAHAVWVGDCLIGKNADGTDTYELNRNLVLTENAKADSVPNLEIENGEIEGAGHASATGRFDDEQLFYLMSRGVSEMDARRLVVRGFFAELIQEIGIPEVVDHLMDTIEAELESGGTLSAPTDH